VSEVEQLRRELHSLRQQHEQLLTRAGDDEGATAAFARCEVDAVVTMDSQSVREIETFRGTETVLLVEDEEPARALDGRSR
jgi:ElaB/YqjD/DUF883 family membrane-anchored ribosome-binding protein